MVVAYRLGEGKIARQVESQIDQDREDQESKWRLQKKNLMDGKTNGTRRGAKPGRGDMVGGDRDGGVGLRFQKLEIRMLREL